MTLKILVYYITLEGSVILKIKLRDFNQANASDQMFYDVCNWNTPNLKTISKLGMLELLKLSMRYILVKLNNRKLSMRNLVVTK